MNETKLKIYEQGPITWYNPCIYWATESSLIHSSDFNPANDILALAAGDDVILYQIDERINAVPKLLSEFKNTQIDYHSSKVSWSEDGNLLAVSSGKNLKIFTKQILEQKKDEKIIFVENWKIFNDEITCNSEIVDVKFTKNQSLIVLTADEIQYYEFSSKKFILTLYKTLDSDDNEDPATSMVIDPLLEFIAVQYSPFSSQSWLQILDFSNFEEICKIPKKFFVNASQVSMDFKAEADFTPDGKFLIAPRGIFNGKYCAQVFARDHFERGIATVYASLFTIKFPPRIVKIYPKMTPNKYLISLAFGARVAFFDGDFEPVTMIANVSTKTPLSTISFARNGKVCFIACQDQTSGSICKIDFQNLEKSVEVTEDVSKMKPEALCESDKQ